MQFEKDRANNLIEIGDYPFSDLECEKLFAKYNLIVEFAMQKVGGAFTDEQKEAAKETWLKKAENSKTKLQYVNTFLTLIKKLKEKKLINLNEEQQLINNIAKNFKSSAEKLEEVYAYTQGLQISAGTEPIKQNHKTAMSALISLAKLLNKHKIEYHIVGALPCYLLAEGELVRYHDDIDIIVDDKDIDKIVKLAKTSPELKNFLINDDREHSSSILDGFDENGKPICKDENPHQVLFQHKQSEFHIGFFQYEQREYGTREMKTYYTDAKTQKTVVYYPYSLTEDDWQKEYGQVISLKDENGEIVEIPCSTVKSVYDKKDTDRPKDIFDRQFLEPYVNNSKISK